MSWKFWTAAVARQASLVVAMLQLNFLGKTRKTRTPLGVFSCCCNVATWKLSFLRSITLPPQRSSVSSLIPCSHVWRTWTASSFATRLFRPFCSYLVTCHSLRGQQAQSNSGTHNFLAIFLFIFIFSSGTTFFWRHVQLNSLSIEGEM